LPRLDLTTKLTKKAK